MNNVDKALVVLIRSRDEILSEIARAGESGGVGRAQNFAAPFDSVCNAIEHCKKLRQSLTTSTEEAPAKVQKTTK